MPKPGYEQFDTVDTAADDVCLIAFTSGTTGEPKGTMHFHRDLLATCDSYGRYVLRASPVDRFIGSPPLAFTFGLGGLVLFPHAGRRILGAAGEGDARRAAAGDRDVPRHRVLHGADRLPGDAGQARRARHHVAAQMRVGRRGAAQGARSTPGSPRPASS